MNRDIESVINNNPGLSTICEQSKSYTDSLEKMLIEMGNRLESFRTLYAATNDLNWIEDSIAREIESV